MEQKGKNAPRVENKTEDVKVATMSILERMGAKEAQINLIFPQFLTFISRMEAYEMFTGVAQSTLSWSEFLANIPEENLPSHKLYDAYSAAHKHFGIPNKSDSSHPRFRLPNKSDVLVLIDKYLLSFWKCEGEIPESTQIPDLLINLDEHMLDPKKKKSFDSFISALGVMKEFITSSEFKKTGKLVKKLYDQNDMPPKPREVRDSAESEIFFMGVWFREKFKDPEFTSMLIDYMHKNSNLGFTDYEDKDLYAVFKEAKLLRNPRTLATVIEFNEMQRLLIKLLQETDMSRKAVNELIGSLYSPSQLDRDKDIKSTVINIYS
jgi:hypothetical protein